MSVPDEALTELVGPPPTGRVFRQSLRPGFADCAPSGRLRLDALARWLQDVAYADVEDAGLVEAAAWVVRRTRVRVERFPRFGEQYTAATFCSGLGRMWAERRTTIVRLGAATGEVEAATLWVHLDPTSWRPKPLTGPELDCYGQSARGRRVRARLRHPLPGAVNDGRPWAFRAVDLDIAGHVNNASYWQPLEEELLETAEPEAIDAELEYRTPSQPGRKLVLRDGHRRWIVGEAGEVHASILIGALAGRSGAGGRAGPVR